MAIIDAMNIYYGESVIGKIVIHDNNELSFVYDSDWLNAAESFPLSVTMPLTNKKYENSIIIPWLANLLPEENNLRILSKNLGVAQSDTLTILQKIGGDTAGAISIYEPSIRSKWTYVPLTKFYKKRTNEEALIRHFDDLESRPFLVGKRGVRLSLAGGQQKTALAVLDATGEPRLGIPGAGDQFAVPQSGAPSTIIIKPGNPKFEGIVENEAYCLALANQIGLPVANAKIIQVGGQKSLVVERYDRTTAKDGYIQRLHQEDFAQAGGFFPGEKYEGNIGRSFTMTDLLSTRNHIEPKEQLKLLDQVIFNILVSNTDAHAKNYSLLLSGRVAMAPLYDVLTTLPWKKQLDQKYAQKLAGKMLITKTMVRGHWQKIAEESKLNPARTVIRVKHLGEAIIEASPKTKQIVQGQAGANSSMVERVGNLIENNVRRILTNLKKT